LADFGGKGNLAVDSATLTDVMAAADRTAFKLTYVLRGDDAADRTVVEDYVLTREGVELTTRISGNPVRSQARAPVLVNDGADDLQIDLKPAEVSIVNRGSATSIQFLTAGTAPLQLAGQRVANHNGYLDQAVLPMKGAAMKFHVELSQR